MSLLSLMRNVIDVSDTGAIPVASTKRRLIVVELLGDCDEEPSSTKNIGGDV